MSRSSGLLQISRKVAFKFNIAPAMAVQAADKRAQQSIFIEAGAAGLGLLSSVRTNGNCQNGT
jgi:hypothetical protein